MEVVATTRISVWRRRFCCAWFSRYAIGSTRIGWRSNARAALVLAAARLRAESVTARRTVHSDHRMVVCDLVIGRQGDGANAYLHS